MYYVKKSYQNGGLNVRVITYVRTAICYLELGEKLIRVKVYYQLAIVWNVQYVLKKRWEYHNRIVTIHYVLPVSRNVITWKEMRKATKYIRKNILQNVLYVGNNLHIFFYFVTIVRCIYLIFFVFFVI